MEASGRSRVARKILTDGGWNERTDRIRRFVAILAWVADVDKTLLRAYRNWRATRSQ